MKSVSWKKVVLAAVAIVIALAGVFYFTSSKGTKNPSLFVNPAFAEYINSYTTGVVPSGSVLNIIFPGEMVDSMSVGRESSEKLFDFKPSIAGKAFWVDQRTIEFRPEKRMQSGQIYTAKFYLSKLVDDLPDGLQIFEYSFQVVPQNFEVAIVNVKASSNSDLRRQVIEGNFNTADFAEGAQVEKTIAATQE